MQKEILEWAESRGILKYENRFKQYTKLQEESNELLIAMLNNDDLEMRDAIGDCLIVLIILAKQLGYDYEQCLVDAYNIIKERKGKLINGVFVKD